MAQDWPTMPVARAIHSLPWYLHAAHAVEAIEQLEICNAQLKMYAGQHDKYTRALIDETERFLDEVQATANEHEKNC